MSFLSTLPIAHRGLHDETKPENSLSAFQAAVACGYAIEMDVRFTKDKELVVFHDDSLFRMTGENRLVSDCTLADLSKLRLAGTEEHIPTFAEFLSAVDGHVPLLIEIKNMPGVSGMGIAKALADALKRYKGAYAVQSFSPFYVKAYRELGLGVPCGLLATASKDKREFGNSFFWRLKAYVVRNLSLNFTVRPDFIAYRLEDLPRRRVTKFKGTKLAWTVRSPEDEARARNYVDNIIFENYIPKK